MVAKIEQTSFDILGKRWTALIVQELIHGPRRFRELLTALGRINDKVLSQRLKELEGRGLIARKVFAEVPVRVEYTLTERGRGLAGVIQAMEQWDSSWANGGGNGKGGRPQMPTIARSNGSAAQAPSPAAERATGVEPSSAAVPVPPERVPFWKRFGL